MAVLVRIALGLSWVLAVASCAPGLEDPERFEAEDVCDLDVQRDLLVPRCARTGCHIPYEPAAGVEYLSGGLAERLVGVSAFTCPTRLLIDPENPAESFLLERLSEDPRCEGEEIDPMPLDGRGRLNEQELGCVTRWVESFAGTPVTPAPDAGPPASDGGP